MKGVEMDAPGMQGDERRPGMRVLVVDDCRDTARMMRVLLRARGYEIELASTGREALEVAGRFRPGVVLVDIGLPGMDGYEVASLLRGQEYGRDAVIIAVSGYREDEHRRSREAGFDHHLVKPLDHEALLSLLPAGGTGRG